MVRKKPVIEVKNISFRYEGALKNALNNVSLSINDGEMLAIVGSNGSGKSTLARHLNGLLLPFEGSVLVDGLDTKEEASLLPIRQKVGIVFQNPDNQLVTTIVEEDVGFGPENLGIPSAEIQMRVEKALDAVGMLGSAKKSVAELSGGQKQRIAIAGILAIHPKVIVLDEATAMLDPVGRQDLLNIVTKLNREEGMTVIMISQYMEETFPCDRVIVMKNGSILEEGTPKQIFASAENLRSCGLDVPETVWLRNRLSEKGMQLADEPLTIEETAEAICRSLSKN